MLKRFLAFALCAAFTVSAPLSGHAAGEKKLDIAASAPGGTWYVGLGAYAKVLSAMYPEFDTTLFPGGGREQRGARGAGAEFRGHHRRHLHEGRP